MITERTVFVIGAGAHVPYGFPTGQGLKDAILALEASEIPDRNHDLEMVDAHLQEFKRAFRSSLDRSIDTFLATRPDLSPIGKVCIASVIMRCEFETRIREEMDGKGRNHDWVSWLMSEYLRTSSLDEFSQNAVGFVTFNYDRCLEYLLMEALRAQFNVGEAAAAKALSKIPVIHVHGSLGRLPWQQELPENDFFRPLDNTAFVPSWLLPAAGCIQLFHEKQKHVSHIEEANQLLGRAKYVFLLGFGYLKDNLKKLRIPFQKQDVYVDGTCYGLSDNQRINLRNQLFGYNSRDLTACPAMPKLDSLAFLQSCEPLLALNKLV